MNESSIIRVEHDKTRPYFVMNRALAENACLSYAARGMMCYLLAKPSDWQVRIGDLIKQSPGGLYHVRAILKELEAHGYLKRTRQRMPNGRFVWSAVVYESPPVSFPPMVSPPVGNQPI